MTSETIEWTAPGGGMWQLEATHLRGAQPRMLQELSIDGFGNGFRSVAAAWGLPVSHVDIGWVNDHCYGRMVPVGAPEPKPGKPAGPPPKAVLWLLARLHPELRRRSKAAKRALATKPWLAAADRWATEQRPARLAACRSLQAEDLAAVDDAALVDHLHRVGTHFQTGMSLHFDLTAAHEVPLGRFLVACRGWGIEPADAMARFAGCSPASAASAAGLAAIAEACAAAGVEPRSIDDVRDAGPAAAAALDAYLADHGWRVVAQYSPRAAALIERPDLLVRAVRAAATATRPPAPDVAPLRSRVPAVERDRFDELLAEARACYPLRDDNVALTFMWPAGLLRRALLEAGRRLAARGVLAEPEHVLALGEAEIADALTGGEALGAVAAERVAHGIAAEAAGAPTVLGDDEGPPPDPRLFPPAMAELLAATLLSFQLEEDFVGAATAAEPVWSGDGVGIGTTAYTGRACVAVDAEEALDRLQEGDVLVTTHTTPAYEAILPIAGALVTEEGGLMSHAAIVSREHGIPAVLGCAAATSTIVDGDLVTVDPDAGRVLPTAR